MTANTLGMRRRRRTALLALTSAAVALLPLTAAAAAAPERVTAGASTPHYAATVRRTEHGVPHITAADYGGLGYGYAYSFAQDAICTMAEQYVTLDAQRSLFFGPDATYAQRGNGTAPTNLNSDAFWQQVIDDHRVDRLVAAPDGPKPELKQLVKGYVAGWNRYLADVGGSAGIADPTCRGKAWVRPITEDTAFRRFYQLTLLASQGVAIDGIGGAQPPPPGAPAQAAADPQALTQQLGERFSALAIGSNAVAVGRGGTADKTHGLLLGNPHFPYLGTERFYQAQLTIPGEIDVEGASLYGVPLILIGHTADMAWSHTVSTAFRFTPYQLTLDPSDPTRYVYDGVSTPMSRRTVTVRTGPATTVTRTLFSTRFGPMFTGLLGLPFPWTQGEAFAMRDVNDTGLGALLNHFLDVDRAHSARAVLGILERYQGIPWVNTIVADRGGDALYADIGAVPHVTDDQARTCASPLGVATFAALGLPTLDGSRSACEWGTDPSSARPGLLGASTLPRLFRPDYVTNSNDSYWLSNPHEPLAPQPRIVGDHDTARSLRTRVGLLGVQSVVDGGGFTRQRMQDLVFDDRQYAAELVRDDLVTLCRSMGGTAPRSAGPPVALGPACDVLAAWDLHEDVGSRGALLFRRFWAHAVTSAAVTSVAPFLVPFSASDPVRTPNTLNPALPQVRTALGDAVADLAGAGIPLDAPLGDWQYATRGSERIPLPGGPGTYGEFNAVNAVWDPQRGYPNPPHGSSYVQVVTWHDATGCPDAATIVTYSQSPDPTSPFYADQTRMFPRKQWATERFCPADIAAHALSTTRLDSVAGAGAPGAAGPTAARGSRSGAPAHRAARPARARPAARQPARSLAFTGAAPGLAGSAVLLLAGGLLLLRRRRAHGRMT